MCHFDRGAEVTLAQQLRSTKFEGRPEHALQKKELCYLPYMGHVLRSLAACAAALLRNAV